MDPNTPLLRKRRVLGLTDTQLRQLTVHPSGCVEWSGYVRGRYPLVRFAGKQQLLHRALYTHMTGDELADGMTLDHLCRNTRCVAPAHLEPVPLAENIHRGRGAGARNARKTHCAHGHPFDAANTRDLATGRRRCIACEARWQREYRARKATR